MIKDILSKLFIVGFSLTKLIFKRFKRIDKDDIAKNVLIFIPKYGIGDMALRLNSIHTILYYLSKDKECTISIATDNAQINILKKLGFTDGIDFIKLNSDGIYTLDRYFQDLSNLKKCRWTCIVSLDVLGGYIKAVLAGVDYNLVVAPNYDDLNNASRLFYIFDKLLPNLNLIKFDYTREKMVHRVKIDKIIVKIFIEAYFQKTLATNFELLKYNIPVLSNNLAMGNRYCIVSAGMSNVKGILFRCWPLDRYAKIIDFIITELKLKVYLTGDKNDIDKNQKLYSLVCNKEHVYDVTAKTSFQEWIELIRGADFVFGNDSGYIHMAAMLDTQSFVVAGYWNYGRFLPYDDTDNGLLKPVDIRIDRPSCALCHLINWEDNDTYKKCNLMTATQGTYLCIEKITTESVIKKITTTK